MKYVCVCVLGGGGIIAIQYETHVNAQINSLRQTMSKE